MTARAAPRRSALPSMCVGGILAACAVPVGATAVHMRQLPSESTAAQTVVEPDRATNATGPTWQARLPWRFPMVQRQVDGDDSERRRDPFVSLLVGRPDVGPFEERPEGLAGLRIGDVSLTGLVASGGSYFAVMQGPDGRAYMVRGQESMFDGVVKTVTAEGVIFLQQVSDPGSLVTEREVVKTLGSQEKGK